MLKSMRIQSLSRSRFLTSSHGIWTWWTIRNGSGSAQSKIASLPRKMTLSRERLLAGLGRYQPAMRQRPVSAALQVYAAMATSASTGAARDITLIARPDK